MKYFLIIALMSLFYSCETDESNANKYTGTPLYHTGDIVYLKPDSTEVVMKRVYCDDFGNTDTWRYIVSNPNWNRSKEVVPNEIFGKKK